MAPYPILGPVMAVPTYWEILFCFRAAFSPNSRRMAYVKPSSALFLSMLSFSFFLSLAQILFHLHLRCLSPDGAIIPKQMPFGKKTKSKICNIVVRSNDLLAFLLCLLILLIVYNYHHSFAAAWEHWQRPYNRLMKIQCFSKKFVTNFQKVEVNTNL